MKKFLREAAEKIIYDKHFGEQSVVILPNRRSEVFLKEEIKKISTTSIWLPEFYPIDEFIQKLSGLAKADNISIFFDLYNIHQKITGKDAKSIDEFLTWAPVILSDFNDIDGSMADAKDVFTQLSAVKAIQQWNPDGSPLTQLQQNYLDFFNSMYDYYSALNTKLISGKTGYQGLINRYAAKNISSILKKHHWSNFLIVGINALSQSEILVLDFINKNLKTSFIWDVDEYYFSKNAVQNNQQEAGKQIRRVIDQLKLEEPDNIGNNLSTSKKTINILGIPKNIGQAKFMGQELQKQFNKPEPDNNEEERLIPSNTAIVLANEELLIPLLNSLPQLPPNNEKHYNVTLGYPLSNSQVEHFFNTWIELIITKSQNNGKIPASSLISLLNNPLIKQLMINNDGDKLIKYIITNNISVTTSDEVYDILNPTKKSNLDFLIRIISIKKEDNVATALEHLKNTLISVISINNNLNILIKEQVQHLIKIISKLILLSADNEKIINYFAIKKIGRQLISLSTINLIGRPLDGIQIMGMLETRNLDFDNIYILSANEGIIPKTSTINSFIPMDIRRLRNLPMPSDNSDIYAYHFYRLLQRAKNITLVYNSDADKLGGGEKSRFILQIENELSKINPLITKVSSIINTNILHDNKQNIYNQDIVVFKNESIINRLKEIAANGYSPSVLGSYISCPLKFYFSHILKLSTTTTIEQSVEANTFGTVAHAVLEEIYKPMEGRVIDVDTLKKHLVLTRKLISNQFKNHYNNGDLKTGKNLLISEVAHNYINSFLKWDINNLKQSPATLKSTEIKLATSVDKDSVSINFKGIIDRIDSRQNSETVSIIDYKTGKVETRDLVVKNIEEITTNPKYAKAFQVIFYAWLYYRNHPKSKIETGIISLRSMSNGYITLKITDSDNIIDYLDDFTDSIMSLVNNISDKSTAFIQTDDIKRCTWCDYKDICNR